MDDNTKKKIILIKDLIKKQKYQQALQQAQILSYKNSKLYQAHLMAGLCYQKLHRQKQAQKSYLQVIDLKPDEPNALKALCDLYAKMNNVQKSTIYMQSMLKILKNTDPLKYRQNLVKLVELYSKNLEMEKISQIFKQLLESQNQITEQFVKIAQVYFNTAVINQCFYLDQFMPFGIKGQVYRKLQPNAKQKLNRLLIEIVRYLNSVKLQYGMSNKEISASIYQLKQSFPYASCFLMLFLFDEYIISQVAYNSVVLQQIYMFLTAYNDKMDNCYLNVQTLEPQYFIVSAILSYQFLAFMKQFFILDQCFNPYYQKLSTEIPQLESRKIRQQYLQKISKFILKQCRTVNKISSTQNIQNRLQSLNYRISKLQGSYLQQVLAKMGMNSFVNYQKLSQMRNLLKTRIKNLKKQGQGQVQEIQPHLYKYYYDYLIKIAKLYKSLDQELSIYDVISYIKKHDLIDNKYLVEYWWIQLGKNSKEGQEKFLETARNSLNHIEHLIPSLIGSDKSQSIRKQTILNILLENYDGVLDGFKLAIGIDRSFQNLQSMAFYYFIQGDFEKSLRYLKEAFIIRQDDYHLNRAIFVAMVKINDHKQAYAFLQRIYEGFPNVYWLNFALAINYINNKKIQLAYKHLSVALQAFTAGLAKTFKFSYQKTVEGKKYSLIYMIEQNKHHLFLDQIVIPQATLYQIFPMASSLFFDNEQQLKHIRIQTLLGQILKILGRNKSSYNHLASAHAMLQNLTEQTRKNNPLQVISTKKQFATILFYVRAYKEAEQLLKNTLKICQQYQSSAQLPKNLLVVYQSQIHSLMFEVSVMRLDELMKFESYEAVQQYINKFSQDLKQIKGVIKKLSLNYYKAKYQFYILCYLHNKNLGVDQSINTIKQYLQFFGLDSSELQSDKFYNRLVELSTEQKIIVKQCLQDYYVLLYMKQNSSNSIQSQKITAENVLPLIQLFPTSNVFYIVYGMAVTQTKLKISAFLKCIQLDRQSPISVDLLASLFLKQKDYLTACKLFLKSLEIDLFNPKSYIGLCTCLYVLIGSSIKRGNPQDKPIIRKALNKINSYMDFLRISDPSQNYHLLKFLKTLISDEPIPLFELKAGLQQSRKLTAHKYSQKLLFKLLQDCTQYLKQFNVWKKQGQQQVFQMYLTKNKIQSTDDLYQIGKQLLCRLQKQSLQYKFNEIKSGEIRIKIKCKILNKVCIIGNIFKKAMKLQKQQLNRYLKYCQILQQTAEIKDQQLFKLQTQAKQLILSAIIKSSKQSKIEGAKVLQILKQINLRKLFINSPTFTHIRIFLDNFTHEIDLLPLKRYIFSSMHLFPCDAVLRKILLGWLLIVQKKNNKITKKIKQSIDYRLQGTFQMNSDSQINNTAKYHKKYAIMYNIQQPNAWIGFIASEWQNKKQTKWLQHLIKILKKYENQENILTLSSKQKAYALIVQISAWRLKNKQNVNFENIPKKLLAKVIVLGKLFSAANSNDQKQLVSLAKDIPKDQQIWAMKYIAPYLVNKYQHSQTLQAILDKCIQECEPKSKGFYYLLKFISVCSKPAINQDSLIDQLKKLLALINSCQSQNQLKVHTNSISIMKCMVSLLSLNYQQLQQQLNSALNKRVQAYSDSIIINYFQLMRIYREVQINHQGQNVYQNFTYFVDCMIGLAKQPYLKGYFYALKAMAGAIVAQESNQKLSKEVKFALLLSPQAGKSLLVKK